MSDNVGMQIGTVTAYFAKPEVAIFELVEDLEVGDVIRIKGHTTDILMQITSMQINKVDFKKVPAGSEVGVKVDDKCRKGDIVYWGK